MMKRLYSLRRWLGAGTLAGILSLAWSNAVSAQDPAQFRIGYQKGSVSLVLAKTHRLLEQRFPSTKISWIEFPAGRKCSRR
ncbi:Putative aliphatic sulfonates-binding protein precursor [Serratia plymuthica]|uniref:Aliphatic sulfonates-binding protein n=1 Tax=Serratia plymuthica TaxID=82996 RepID=A0A2X4ULL9_SERPL|nr:Putative aliphatic sulfonates-binding protein precursor [Serratia plymuthica]